PKTGELAFALMQARAAGIPLKFTAGLHHPFRHYDEQLGIMMHGFLNVFAAGVLGFAQGLPESDVEAMVNATERDSFQFDSSGLRSSRVTATCAQIETARQHTVTSFGSCSFDEPREDLRKLGLLA